MELFGLTFVMFAGAVVALIGIVMLMIRAFTTSAAWGFASLLIPPLAIGFGLTHWSKSKNGIAVVMIGLIVLGYGFWDNDRQQRIVATEKEAASTSAEPFEQAASAPETKIKSSGPAPAPAPAPANTASAEPLISKAPVRAAETDTVAPTIINMIDAHKFIDSEIRVTTTGGNRRTGILVEVKKDGIVLDYVPAGVKTRVTAEIDEEKIELMELVH